MLFILLLGQLFGGIAIAADPPITTTGRTATTILREGNITDISTTSIFGINALNEFGRFNVAGDITVNLHVPDQALNLLNLVRDEASVIDGVVNSWYQGGLGGNVFFLNPYGIAIGQGGQVNVGSLTLITPTQAFMDEFFDAASMPDAAATLQVLEGQVPIAASGLVTVYGQVLATKDVNVNAGAVTIDGGIQAGGAGVMLALDAANLMNLDGMDVGAAVAVTESGSVQILAADDITNRGEIHADGGNGVDAGRVTLRAGGDLTLAAESLVSASGAGLESGGGLINLFANDSAYLRSGATLDVSAGDNADGGAIEFSAQRSVVLDGGQFDVGAAGGNAGSVLINPESIDVVSANMFSGGGDITLDASQSLTVNPGVVISTRQIASSNPVDHATAVSTGDSGDLSITAPVITIGDSAGLYAHAVNDMGTTFSGGDVALTAVQNDGGTASIALANADVRGANVSLSATAVSNTQVLDLLVTDATAIASIAIADSTIAATGEVVVSSVASINAQTGLIPLPVSSIDANALASLEVTGASVISSGADKRIALAATADVITDATPSSFLDDLAGDAGVSRSDIESIATVHVGDSSQITSGGAVEMVASNTIDALANADAAASGATSAGAAVAVSVVNAQTSAFVDGAASINAAGDLTVSATSSVTSRATASAATQGASMDMDGDSQGAATLNEYEDEASTSDGGVQVAGAVAVGDINNTTRASLGSTAMSQAGGNAAIISNATESSTVTGDGSAASGAVGVGVGVAINIGHSENTAFIDQMLSAMGLDLQAGDGATSVFETSATAGAGASSVGVAGALAVNVLDDSDVAEIRSGTVTANGGDVSIRANSATTSTASATPVEDGGATGSQVGVGASVAMNIAARSARAVVSENVDVVGANAVTIDAIGRHAVTTAAEAGAAGGVAVTPVLALSTIDNQTIARLDSGAPLIALGPVAVRADHRGTLTTTASADAAGDKVGLGGAFAISTLIDRALAKVDRSVTSGGAVTLSAFNGSVSSSSSTAGANGGDSDDQSDPNESGIDQAVSTQQGQADMVQASNGVGNDDQPMGDDDAPSAQTSEGKVNVAAAVTVAVARSFATAELTDGSDVMADGDVTVVTANNTDAAAMADASTVGGDAAVGVGAAIAINRVVSENKAQIGNAEIIANGIIVNALMNDLGAGDTANTALVTAMSGAGAGSVGVAGSLALNVIEAQTLAEVRDGARLDAGGGDVVLMAAHESEATANALPAEDGGASGDKVGVGASVALNLGSGQSTVALFGNNVSLTDALSLTLDAYGVYDVTTTAKAGAEGGVAVDAVVALAELDETTEARVGEGAALDLGGSLTVNAQSSGTRVTNADADLQSVSVGVGAAAAVVISTSRTRAIVARDVTATGNMSLSAMSDRSYDTEATAGARGAMMDSVEEPSEKRDNTTSTSTIDDTSDAQKGGKDGGKVSVAAAVAVSSLDDDVEASVTGGRTLTLGGDLAVSATNESNFSSRGRGDAVDSTVAVGIGVGLGLSIAKNDTLAQLADGTRIANADAISVMAESKQNIADEYINMLAAEAIAGAGARRVGVAGAFGVAFSEATTIADVGQIVVDDGGVMTVSADNTSKLSAKAWSGARGRVGVGASVATVYSDNVYAASIGAGSDLTVDGLNVTANNRVVEGDVGFDWKDFANLTNDNLQLLLGNNNYYTEAIAGSAGGSVAVSGAFSVNVFSDTIRAEVEAADDGSATTTITTTGDVKVDSSNDVRARAFAGALGAASKVGVGLSTADIANTTQSISSLAGLVTANDVTVAALSEQDFAAFSVSGSGAGNTGVSGAATVVVSENDVRATVAEGSEVVADNNLVVAARNDVDITNIAGGAAGGGTAGIGISAAVNVIKNETRAEIARNALVRANANGSAAIVPLGNLAGDTFNIGGVSVTATATEDLFTIAAGGGGGGSAGVAGSGAVNVLGVSTLALIAEGVMVNDAALPGSISQSVYVMAADHTDSFTVAGAVAGGGSAGVGAGADVSVMSKDTQAYIQAADVRAAGNVRVAARSSEEISSLAATVGIGGSAGVAGSAVVQVVDIKTRAFIGQDEQTLATPSVVIADGSVTVEAEDKTEIDMLAGGVSGGGSAGIGASATVAVVNKQTDAFIGANSRVDGLGLRAAVDAATGRFDITRVMPVEEEGKVDPAGGDNNADLTGDDNNDIDNEALTTDRVATAGRAAFTGVAVTATNQDDIATIAASGGGAGSVAVNVSGSVVVLNADTNATIDDGATVNAAQGPAAQSVRVAATNDFQRLGVAAAVGGAGAVGVTPGADITVANIETLATIGDGTTVKAGGDIEVLATASEDVLTVAAGAAAAGTVAVGGAVSVVSLDTQTRAQIGAGAQNAAQGASVDADGNVIVAADDQTETLLIAGSLGIGIGAAGIGGSVGVTSINKDTRALIGNFASVNADGNTADVNGIALAGEESDLALGPLATRDGFSGLLVQATSAESVQSIAAAAAGGFYAGLAGGVSIQTIDSDTFAAIGSSALVDAGAGAGSEEVLVAAANELDAFGFGGGLAGGFAGIGGGVDVGVVTNDTAASIGANSNVAASGDLTLLALADKDVRSIAASGAGGVVAVAGSVSVWSLGTASDDNYSVDEENQETGETMTRTDQAVDQDGMDSTTDHVDMQSNQFAALLDGYDDPDMNEDAMAGLTSARTDVAGVQAGTAAAGALSDAAVAAGTSATVEAGAVVTAGDSLRVQAGDRTAFRVDAGAVSVGALGIGAAIGVASIDNTTTARVAQGATLRAGADADDDIWIKATMDEDVNGLVAAGAAGGVALGAQVLVVNDDSSQNAIMEDAVSVTGAGGTVNVSARGTRTANLDSTGATVGGGGSMGVATAVTNFSGGSTARVGAVEIGQADAVGAVAISATMVDAIVADTQSVAAGLQQALTGSFAVAQTDATVLAAITSGALVNTGGAIDIAALSQSTTTANATGVAISGGLSGGASVAVANAAPNVTARVSDDVALTAGGDIAVRARHNVDTSGNPVAGTGAVARAIAGSGGLLGGAAGAVANADSSATVRALVAAPDGVSGAPATTLSAMDSVMVSAAGQNAANASTVGVGVGAVLGVGISLANATVAGIIDSLLAAGNVTGTNIGVDATGFDTATAKTLAGGGGIIAGSGAVATADIDSSTTAATGDDAVLVATSAIDVAADVTATAIADAKGINGGAISVGVSEATASTAPRVEARLGNNTQLTAGTLNVSAERKLPGSGISASANASGSSGGLIGVSATSTLAEDNADVTVRVGDNSNLTVTGLAQLIARNTSRQDATASSVTGGIIAAGANLATANSDNSTLVQLGDGSSLFADQLTISAVGADTNYADSKAGSGGVISGSAAQAQTSTTANTVADTGSGNIVVRDLSLSAQQTSTFDSRVNSVNASLVGASGALAENAVDSTAATRVGNNGTLMANDIDIAARNIVRKERWGAGNGWNITSGSGGAIDAPAAETRTTIKTATSLDVGTGASIIQLGDRDAPGQFILNATNDVRAYDRVRMNSGGAVSVAKGESQTFADSILASILIGENANLRAVGDINIGARATGDVRNAVAVDTYGLAGAPSGQSTATFTTTNRVDIGAGAQLSALRDVTIGAGIDSAGDKNNVNATARTDLWNNSAIPINGQPEADARIASNNSITLKTDAEIAAVRDARLLAVRGTTRASGVGIGKDIYREALAAAASAISNAFGGGDVSFDIHGGSRRDTATGAVTVDGSVRVGTESRLELTFDVVDGMVVETRMVNGVEVGPDEGIQMITGDTLDIRNVVQDILDRIDALNVLIQQYAVDDADADTSTGIAVRAYESEVAFLERKLVEMGFQVEEGQTGFAAVPTETPQQIAQARVDNMNDLIDERELEQMGYVDENAMLEDTNAQLDAQNMELDNLNAMLSATNMTLMQTNAGLAATNEMLMDQQAALDPMSPTYDMDFAALQMMIDANQMQIDDNTVAIGINTMMIADNTTTIGNNTATIGMNLVTIDANIALIMNLDVEIANLNADLVAVGDPSDYSNEPTAGPSAEFRTIDDVTAQLGNIFVEGTDLSGTGLLEAPGNALIRIVNRTPTFLQFNDLIIPANTGGKLFVNNVDVSSNAAINSINRSGNGAAFSLTTGASVGAVSPMIEIISFYDPLDSFYVDNKTPTDLPPLAPDVIVTEGSVISNLRGSVTIDLAAGNIRIEENTTIAGNEINIETRNGDFVQSYTDGFTHVISAPLVSIPAADPDDPSTVETQAQAGQGIVANGSILLAGRYLNINGTVQSGIPEWGVTIPGQSAVVAADGTMFASFDAARIYYMGLVNPGAGAELFQVLDASVTGLPASAQGGWTQIGVNFNARENRLELAGVQVQGGYIELFGQIFNTNQGVGQLRVLDGFGHVRINNTSGLDLMLNVLDTGRGVRGQINVTNILADESVADTMIFARGAGAPRTGLFYNPQGGLRFSTVAGRDVVTRTRYVYSQEGWFGINTGASALTDAYIVGQSEVADPLSSGSFLRLDAGNTSTISTIFDDLTVSEATVAGDSWRDCNWWTLCINSTHYREYFRTTGSKVVNGYSVRGDYGIGIEFIGFDEGLIDINSIGGVLINGSLNNPAGDIRINSAGAIEQLSATAIATGANIDLIGSTIGSADQMVRIAGLAGGALNATAVSGDIFVNQLTGVMNVGTVAALNGMAVLASDDDILGVDGTSVVQANRVELTSRSGGIGSGSVFDAAGSFAIETGVTTSLDPAERALYGLVAEARDGIKIANNSGDLMVIDVHSSAGDVRLQASGSIVDNNPVSRTDERAEDELNALWDSMRLRGTLAEQKAADEIIFFETGATQDYRTYWNQRNRQADPNVYDATYTVTLGAAEEGAIRDQLATQGRSQMEIDDIIASYAQDRTDEYHRLHQRLYESTSANALGGDIPDTFDADFRYTASASEIAERTTGSSWEQFQLELPVAAGLLKEITDTVTEIKDPNVRGGNVVLIAGQNVGRDEAPLVIDLADGLDALDRSERAAIAAAERGDVTVNGSILEIIKRTPVNIEQVSDGAVTVAANSGYAYIGSEMDLYLDQVRAVEDVRIKVAGSLFNSTTSDGPNVIGDTIILEAARGSIGTDTAGIAIEMGPNGAFIARAQDAIYAETTSGDFRLDTLYSRGDVYLTTGGSILDAFDNDDLNLLGSTIWLEANGSIGELANPLDVGTDPQGLLNAMSGPAAGIFLNVPQGTANFGALTSGGMLNLTSSVGYALNGLIQAPGSINLSAVRGIDMGADGALVSMGDQISIMAGSFTMADTARVDADGNLIIEVADREIQNNDGSVNTVPGGAVIATATAGNDATITAGTGGVTVTQALTAGGAVSVTSQQSITGMLIDGGSNVDLTAADDVMLERVTAGADLNVAGTQVDIETATAGAVANVEAGTGGIRLGALTAGSDVNLTSAGTITGVQIAGGANVAIAADDEVILETVTAGADLTASAAQVDIETADVAGSASVDAGVGGARFGTLTAGSDIALASAADVVFNSIASGGATDITAAGDVMVAQELTADGAISVAAAGAITGVRIAGGADVAIAADDELVLETVIAGADLSASGLRVDIEDTDVGGSASVDAGTGGARLGTFTAAADISLTSAAAVTLDQLTANGTIDISAVDNVSGNDGGVAQISAGALAIDSSAGAIGALDQRLVVDVAGNASFSAFSDVGVQARGDLMADLVASQTGSVDLLVDEGTADLGRVSAPERITITTAAGLTAQQISDARSITLSVADEGGRAEVETMTVSESLTVNADNIVLPNVQYLGQTDPLVVDLSGNDGGLAQKIEFMADSDVGVDFVNFKTQEFEMSFNSDWINLTDMEIGEFGLLRTPRHEIVIDNVNRVLYPSATTQLYALNEPFDLSTTNENLIFSTARLINYSPYYIVNRFSTENSLVRLVPKRLTMWDRLALQLTSRPATSGLVSDDEDSVDVDPRGVLWIQGVPPVSLQLD